jgi:Flp pilus assembly protein TadG
MTHLIARACPRHAPARLHRRSRGQALVEFALALPVMIFVLLIAIDFGRVFFSYIEVNNAAREAANNAAAQAAYYQNGTESSQDFYDAAVNAASQETNAQGQAGATAPIVVSSPACFTPGSPPVSISCANAPQDSQTASGIGNLVTVTVTQPFTFFTPLVSNFFGNGFSLSASATNGFSLSASATAPVLNPLVAQISNPTPTPTPTPTATAGPTPTPTPTPTVTPTPTPTPIVCRVPDYYHTYWSDTGSLNTWHNAGFTGTLTDNSGGKQIQSQTLLAGSQVACTSNMSVSNHP